MKRNRKTVSIFSLRALVLITLLALAIEYLYGYQIYLKSQLSTQGIELARLENQTKEIKISNGILRQDILQNQSYAVIATKAAQMGFITIK